MTVTHLIIQFNVDEHQRHLQYKNVIHFIVVANWSLVPVVIFLETTSLGARLANDQYFSIDDYYWIPRTMNFRMNVLISGIRILLTAREARESME